VSAPTSRMTPDKRAQYAKLAVNTAAEISRAL
jgi:DNA-binding IclR family transcriptional regulator